MLLPGSTIGMLGGGQLGRMSLLAGRRMGYRFHVFEPSQPSCAAAVAEATMTASYLDRSALAAFAEAVQLVTLEFENVPASALEFLELTRPVHPGSEVLRICQNRLREKLFLRERGFPCAPFAVVHSGAELEQAVATLGTPCVLKTADFGYDGKGQYKIVHPSAVSGLWERFGAQTGVLEQWIRHRGEFSVIVARNGRGQQAVYPLAENEHRQHILHRTIVPARVEPKLARQACALALTVAETIGVVGLLAVELFLTEDDAWLVNELAPRPHNSGHHTLESCLTSQFEQHIRAVCGLPLGSTELLSPAVMVNLLGEVWQAGPPDWASLLADERCKLHLYDKGEARPGRKMGHFTTLAPTVEAALAAADRGESILSGLSAKKVQTPTC